MEGLSVALNVNHGAADLQPHLYRDAFVFIQLIFDSLIDLIDIPFKKGRVRLQHKL